MESQGCLIASGAYEICKEGLQQCCEGLGCVKNTGGKCCGPEPYYSFMTRKFTDYCSSDQKCCSNTITNICCDRDKLCCANGEAMLYCCDSVNSWNIFMTRNGDWWMWTMFVTMLILFTAIVFVFCLDDSGPVYRHVRRLSSWYHDRYDQSDERLGLSGTGSHQQDPGPPLYQTIVSPTYQYQKPLAPREPPPKYEEDSSPSSAPPQPSSARVTGISGESSVEDQTPLQENETLTEERTEPVTSARGKTKKIRLTSLLTHMQSSGDQNKSITSHSVSREEGLRSIFDANSENTPVICNNTDVERQDIEAEESLVYEFRTESINCLTTESH